MKYEIDINPLYEELSVVIKSPDMNQEVNDVLNKLGQQKKQSISGKIDKKIFVLNPENIYLFYSQNGKVYADMKDKTFDIKQKLYEIEGALQGYSFVRISKSAIVNIHRIKNIEVSFNGSLVVKFSNGHEEIISRRFVSKVKEFIGLGGRN